MHASKINRYVLECKLVLLTSILLFQRHLSLSSNIYSGTKSESVMIAISVFVFIEATLSHKTLASDTGLPKDLFSGGEREEICHLPTFGLEGTQYLLYSPTFCNKNGHHYRATQTQSTFKSFAKQYHLLNVNLCAFQVITYY